MAAANFPVSLCCYLQHASGRAVIAMAAVRIRTCDEPGEIIDSSDVRPPTDATQSRPYPNKKGPSGPFIISTVPGPSPVPVKSVSLSSSGFT